MKIQAAISQLRTTDLDASIAFFTDKLGFELDFRYADFYAGIRAGKQQFHLKLVDQPDPTIAYVRDAEHFDLYFDVADADRAAARLKKKDVVFVKDVHDTPWGTREFVINDDQGHTLYVGQQLSE